jgi:hypothetical protein
LLVVPPSAVVPPTLIPPVAADVPPEPPGDPPPDAVDKVLSGSEHATESAKVAKATREKSEGCRFRCMGPPVKERKV